VAEILGRTKTPGTQSVLGLNPLGVERRPKPRQFFLEADPAETSS
jgi:hypothetical protein